MWEVEKEKMSFLHTENQLMIGACTLPKGNKNLLRKKVTIQYLRRICMEKVTCINFRGTQYQEWWAKCFSVKFYRAREFSYITWSSGREGVASSPDSSPHARLSTTFEIKSHDTLNERGKTKPHSHNVPTLPSKFEQGVVLHTTKTRRWAFGMYEIG